jgi:hypothetical protein
LHACTAVRGHLATPEGTVGVPIKAVAHSLPSAAVALAVLAAVNWRRIQARISVTTAVRGLESCAADALIRDELQQQARASGHKADLRLVHQASRELGERICIAVDTIKKCHKIVVGFGIQRSESEGDVASTVRALNEPLTQSVSLGASDGHVSDVCVLLTHMSAVNARVAVLARADFDVERPQSVGVVRVHHQVVCAIFRAVPLKIRHRSASSIIVFCQLHLSIGAVQVQHRIL